MTPEVFWMNVKKRMGYMRIRDLSAVTGIKESTLGQWMRLGRLPRADQAILIAQALGCSFEDLSSEAVPV